MTLILNGYANDLDAVRRNRLLKKVTRAEVEMVVKLWLRYAIDRSGGRAARMNRRRDRSVVDDRCLNLKLIVQWTKLSLFFASFVLLYCLVIIVNNYLERQICSGVRVVV